MSVEEPGFNTGVISPTDCLKTGWQTIKDEYWLFLGIALVGMLIASVGPFGILAGPAMCGIYICMLRRIDGKRVEFGMLFEGFNHFVQSLIATLILIIPSMVLVVIVYVVIFVIGLVLAGSSRDGGSSIATVVSLILSLLLIVVITLVSLLLGVLFMFTYPLIVDRKMQGVDAVKLSVKAARANLKGAIGLQLLSMLLSFAGALVCCIGMYFVVPITMAAAAIAYRQVFPAHHDPEARS